MNCRTTKKDLRIGTDLLNAYNSNNFDEDAKKELIKEVRYLIGYNKLPKECVDIIKSYMLTPTQRYLEKKDFINNHLLYLSPVYHIIPYIRKVSKIRNIPTECDTLPKLKKLLIKTIDNTNTSYLEHRILKDDRADYSDFYKKLKWAGRDCINELYQKIKIPTYEAVFNKYHHIRFRGSDINYIEWNNTSENRMLMEWYKNSYSNELLEKTELFITTHLNRLFTTFINRIKCKFLDHTILQFIDNSDYYIIQSVQLYHYTRDFITHIFKDRLVKNYITYRIKKLK
jgi:hypothetical protein